MYVVMQENFGTATGPYRRGETYDVETPRGREWVRVGYARESAAPPPHIAQLLARLDDGAGRPCLFLPFVGEFGHQVMSHLRLVHFHRASRRVVCCAAGEEVLYPSADEFFTDWAHPVPDIFRVGTNRDLSFQWPQIEAAYPGHHPVAAGGLSPVQEIVAIRPEVRLPLRPRRRGLRADIILGVRNRAFCPERNWQHWQRLADALTAAGRSFAVIGDKPTSYDLQGQAAHSGDLDTDAAVELLQNCRLYIGTDSGASHLAATVGAEMLLFREDRSAGRDLTDRMRQVNPGRVELIPGAWNRPATVIERALDLIGGRR